VVNLSAWGALDSAAQAPFVFKIIKATVLKNMFADKDRGEKLLVESGLDFVNLRPGQLVDTPAQGGVKASLSPNGLKPRLAREDLATFMIAQLTDGTWVQKSPLLGY
jgi:hypothetical protein